MIQPLVPPALAAFIENALPLIHRAIPPARSPALIQSLLHTEIHNNFNAFHETTKTITRAFEQAGSKTEVTPIPTGGPLASGAWVIHEAADITAASLRITAPFQLDLANLKSSPFHAIQWSTATPPEGITAELLIVESLEHLATLKPRQLQNKIILTPINLYDHAHLLAKQNVAAVIYESNIKNLPDAIAWTKFGWGGIHLRHGPMRLPGMVLSHTQSQNLRQLLVQHNSLTLHIQMSVNRYQGTHDVVSALIEGADDPQSEIWAVAHSAEPGALDNASGVATLVEIAHTLNHLISTNQLPRPKRSIRLLTAYECYGFFHYLEHQKRFTPPLAGLCIDTIGARPQDCNNLLRLHATLPASAGFVDDLASQIIQAALALDNPGYEFKSLPFISTEDTLIADPLHGFPCPWITNHPCAGYHSSADTIERVDPRGLATATAASAAYLYFLANMGTEEALALAQSETQKALSELHRVPCSAEKVAPATPLSMPNVQENPNRTSPLPTPAKIHYLQTRHHTSLSHLKKFLWTGTHSDLAQKFQALESQLHSEISNLKSQITIPSPQSEIPNLKSELPTLIPLRKRPLTPTQENTLPPNHSHIGQRKWTLYWANGIRNLAEIHQLLNLEPSITDPVPLDWILAHFQNLEALGYVQLLDPATLITKAKLKSDLTALGLTPNSDLILHSSLSAIGHVQGGALTVINAILETIAPGGTLLAPSFNHFQAKLYNPLTTPTLNGAIPDALWRLPQAKRSLQGSHPLAAIGPKADYYLHNHRENGIWSIDSPIGRLIQNDGYILSIGVTHNSSTAYHVAEISAHAPCLHQFANTDKILTPEGQILSTPGLAWRNANCPVPTNLLDQDLDAQNLQRHANIGNAPSTLVQAKHIHTLRQQHIAPTCPTCPIRPQPR